MLETHYNKLGTNKFIEKQRSVYYNYLLALTIAFGGFYMGYYLSIFGPFGNELLKTNFKVEAKNIDSVDGNLGLFWAIGCMLGAVTGGYFLKLIGRMKSIIMFEILRLVITLCYSIPNLNVLYVVRVLCGFTVGNFNCICPITTREILPRELVSFGGIMFYGSFSFAILLVSIFGAFIDTEFLLGYYK